MKRIFLAVVAIFMMSTMCYASRVDELTTEAKDLMEKRQQYIQATQQIEVRLIEIQGIMKELNKEEKPKKVKK